MRSREMEPEYGTGMGRLGSLGLMQMGSGVMEKEDGEMGTREMEF